MSHTQGKMHIHKDHPDRVMGVGSNGGGTIFRALLGCCSKLEQEANARRMLACWNACDGLATEDIESGKVSFSKLIQLLMQRNELLEAAKKAIRSLKELVVDDSEEAPAIQGARMRKQNAVRALGAAIQKTEVKV